MSSKIRLGVNIDHVATLRQARGESYPSIVEAADCALEAGADQITIHLREDRRHIQDTDVPAVKMVTERYGKPLNLELGANDEIVDLALEVKPDWVCLVPEKREEKTTEGGLDLKNPVQREKIFKTCAYLKEKVPEIKISLFVEADPEILDECIKMNIDAVEIHTGDFARAVLEENPIEEYIEKFKHAKKQIESQGLGYHAGHGLTDESLKPLAQQNLFSEYNIGHWIICDAVFNGLGSSIGKLLQIIK